MNYKNSKPIRYKLLSRNEGKIKSYESCLDLRGWSHDSERRDRYLREWIRCDMPISVVPASTLICLVKNMTCYSKAMVAPRCHANCKSKILVDSICNSCAEMKECFKNDPAFNKYFEDEQFETSHWPCERCLEALRSLKMFWKIIIEKVFHIKLPKSNQIHQLSSISVDNVRAVAKEWQKDMTRQTMFVKCYNPLLCNTVKDYHPIRDKNNTQKDTLVRHFKPQVTNNRLIIKKSSESNTSLFKRCCKQTDTQDLFNFVNVGTSSTSSSLNHKINRHTSTNFPATDSASSCTELNDKIATYKINLNCLQEKLNSKNNEIQKLKKENGCLKMELKALYNNSWWKSCFNSSVRSRCSNDEIDNIPKPFDDSDDVENVNGNPTKTIDSEMIITLKNCKNESYRHISLVQVIHKTNTPDVNDLDDNKDTCCKKEDPIALLEKVQSRFGAMLSRELSRANYSNSCEETFNIDAFYHKMNMCQ